MLPSAVSLSLYYFHKLTTQKPSLQVRSNFSKDTVEDVKEKEEKR